MPAPATALIEGKKQRQRLIELRRRTADYFRMVDRIIHDIAAEPDFDVDDIRWRKYGRLYWETLDRLDELNRLLGGPTLIRAILGLDHG